MPIQLVTYLLRLLCDKYAKPEQEQEIYQMRKFLDIAFSQCNSKTKEDKLVEMINSIDSTFFDSLVCYDKEANLKAFIFYAVKKFFQNPLNF